MLREEIFLRDAIGIGWRVKAKRAVEAVGCTLEQCIDVTLLDELYKFSKLFFGALLLLAFLRRYSGTKKEDG
ncbi:hypothetical protein [Sphingobacterium bambusae]|uniref:Uncharacterized protein n=1 Tax=Sphingobacterium bambusae TaxID=662858 RepID=A0ABW6BKZ9_9SPHI|nr:hypothetical protein [Sphingobacterium bambusae]WPL46728.1 hypothetical protein SCB77_12190 [Sphingobacterium bambusae]